MGNDVEAYKTFTSVALGVTAGALMGIVLGELLDSRSYIPQTNQVQEGFVNPSKLEIMTKDLDNNGQREVLMNYDGKSYLLREVDGKPVISKYDVRPAEIISK